MNCTRSFLLGMSVGGALLRGIDAAAWLFAGDVERGLVSAMGAASYALMAIFLKCHETESER